MRTIVPQNARVVPKDAKCVFKGVIFDVYQWQQQMFDGSYDTFEMLKRPDTVEVVAVKDGKIVVLEQEQPNAGEFYSFPGGRHDVESESELQAAQRELREETGLTFKTWKLIEVVQPQAKLDWFVYTFLATDFESEVAQELDNGEKITVQYQDLETIKKLADDPKMRHLGRIIADEVDSIDELLQLPEYS